VVQLQIVDCRPSLDIHGVSRSDRLEVRRGDDIRYRTDSRALDYTGQDLLESGYVTSKSGAALQWE